jgi:RNA polymerase sigma factor for flagellar operon FliA
VLRQNTTYSPQPISKSEAERTLLDLLPMVRGIARRIHIRLPPNVDLEDLLSAGLLGLMEATASFDPAKGVPFKAYACCRIQGSILDSLRRGDWAPRDLRRRGRVAQEAIRRLTARRGRVPSEEETAFELRIGLDVYQKLLGDLNGLGIGTLHRDADDACDDLEVARPSGRPEDDPLSCCMREETKKRLTRAIKDLPERERLVTTLHYYEELTQGEIGLLLGKSHTRVQQICALALHHLRSALSDLRLHGGQKVLRICPREPIKPERAFFASVPAQMRPPARSV